MQLEDKDYLSIFDIELRKAQQLFSEANKKFIIKVNNEWFSILQLSPNFMITKKKKYFYRNQYEVIVDATINDNFIFEEVKNA